MKKGLCSVFLSFFLLSGIWVSAQVTPYWRLTTAPRFRQIKAVHFVSDTVFAVLGGNETNDAISSIFQTQDCGYNYDIYFDNIYKCINDAASMTTAIGVGVGESGLILRTMDAWQTWDTITLPANVSGRHFNGVWFTSLNTGYAVGGNPSLDSIQTILKTTDAGISWSVLKDNPGPMLREVAFLTASEGYVVGDSNTILKTTDSGATWNTVSAPALNGSRVFQQIHFLDANNGFIVGGLPSSDSMMTVLRTTNAGANWTIQKDTVASMMNDLDFFSATGGYMAGDDGQIFSTSDGGVTWLPLNLSVSQNDTFAFEMVNFRTQDFGVLAGRGGKVLIWSNYVLGREDEGLNSALQVYPNPVSDRLVVDFELEKPENLRFSLVDATGRILPLSDFLYFESGFSSTEISLNGFTPGLYILHLDSIDGTRATRRIAVVR